MKILYIPFTITRDKTAEVSLEVALEAVSERGGIEDTASGEGANSLLQKKVDNVLLWYLGYQSPKELAHCMALGCRLFVLHFFLLVLAKDLGIEKSSRAKMDTKQKLHYHTQISKAASRRPHVCKVGQEASATVLNPRPTGELRMVLLL